MNPLYLLAALVVALMIATANLNQQMPGGHVPDNLLEEKPSFMTTQNKTTPTCRGPACPLEQQAAETAKNFGYDPIHLLVMIILILLAALLLSTIIPWDWLRYGIYVAVILLLLGII
jgi:hypothetical protein